MAAICGVYFGTGNFSPAVQRQAIRRFASLFGATGLRGSAYSGVVLTKSDGTRTVERAYAAASELALRPSFRGLLADADDSTVAALGYCDEAAAGSRGGRKQPLKIGATVGVYDDEITNGGTLTADLGLSATKSGKGEVIVRLINMALAEGEKKDLAYYVSTRLRLLAGPFVLAAWDRRFPNALFLGRYRRDLYIYHDAHRITYFTNRGGLMTRLFGAPPTTFPFPDNTLAVFDTGGQTAQRTRIFPENGPPGRIAARHPGAPALAGQE